MGRSDRQCAHTRSSELFITVERIISLRRKSQICHYSFFIVVDGVKASMMRPSNAFTLSRKKAIELVILCGIFLAMANKVAAKSPMKVTVVGGTHGNE